MELILWRHAEAEDNFNDLARCLTPRGEKQAESMATWLRPHLPAETIVIASQAKRSQQTAQALTDRYLIRPQLNPGVNVASVLGAAGWPDSPHAVVIVGHQPTLGRIAAFLLAGEEASWSVKKAGIWWLSNRVRHTDVQTVLRAVISPDLL